MVLPLLYEFCVWLFRLYVFLWAGKVVGMFLVGIIYIFWLKCSNPRPIYLYKLKELKKWGEEKQREEKLARLESDGSQLLPNIAKIIGLIAWFLPL